MSPSVLRQTCLATERTVGRYWLKGFGIRRLNNDHKRRCFVLKADKASFESRLSGEMELESGLYVISTPIGNLGDITLRALSILRSVSRVYAEDTRQTLKLFNAFGIQTPLLSCHAQNEGERIKPALRAIHSGEAIGLVCDAGTPTISDPGGQLIAAAVEDQIRVIPVPGASAATAAFTASAFDTVSFLFIGFLPSKKADQIRRLSQLDDIPATLIFYVAPTDILDVLRSCISVFGADKRCCIGREITKIHESFVRGTLAEGLERLESMDVIKGELTLLLEGSRLADVDIPDDLICIQLKSRLNHQAVSTAVKEVSVELGVRKRRVYQLALSLMKQTPC